MRYGGLNILESGLLITEHISEGDIFSFLLYIGELPNGKTIYCYCLIQNVTKAALLITLNSY